MLQKPMTSHFHLYNMSWPRLFILVGGVVAMSLWAFMAFDDYKTNFLPAETSTEINEIQPSGSQEDVNTKIDKPLDRCILPNFDPWDRDIIPVSGSRNMLIFTRFF
ncbi:hypothetical protein COOONC_25481 [Cooperia oncophora]